MINMNFKEKIKQFQTENKERLDFMLKNKANAFMETYKDTALNSAFDKRFAEFMETGRELKDDGVNEIFNDFMDDKVWAFYIDEKKGD